MLGLHCARGFSPAVVIGATLSLQFTGFSWQWLLLSWHTGCRPQGLQQLQLPGSRAQAQYLRCTGLAAPRHVGSVRTQGSNLCLLAGGFFITSARWETHELVGCLNQVPQTQWLKQRVFVFSQAGGCNVRSGADRVGFFRGLSPWACRRPLFHCVHLSSLL